MTVKFLSCVPGIIQIAGLASCSSAQQQDKQNDSAATGEKPGALVVDVYSGPERSKRSNLRVKFLFNVFAPEIGSDTSITILARFGSLSS